MDKFTDLLRDIRDVKYPDIVIKHNEVITKSETLIIEIEQNEELLNAAISGAQQVASSKEEVQDLYDLVESNTVSVTAMKDSIDTAHADIIIKDRSVSDAYAGLLSNLTSINQSIAAANVLKHDIESSTLAAADVNYYLMSTITKADNAQNALDLKVQQNLVALNDIVNDNVMTLETKAQAAGDMIDLKIAMAQAARNELSTIEQSVLIATASADKAALAYEQVSDIKTLVDGVIDNAEAQATALSEATHQGNLIYLSLQTQTNSAVSANHALEATISNAAAPTIALNEAIAEWNVIDLPTLNEVAHAEADRLQAIIPIAQTLSAETSAAVSAAQNISAATNIGNVLLNALEATNTQANVYISSLDSIISNTVDAKVEAVIGTVADAKIEEITAVAIANQEAIDGINDADISMLEI